jgi:hypothetical protein
MKGIDPEPHWPIVNTYSLHTKPVWKIDQNFSHHF